MYQCLPPLCSFLPFSSILLLQIFCILLYLGRCSFQIEKKMKSTTHLSNGPMPAALRMSSKVLLNMLNNLLDNFFPKQTQVLSANSLLCSSPWSLITTPGHWSGARGTILYTLETSLHAPNCHGMTFLDPCFEHSTHSFHCSWTNSFPILLLSFSQA